MALVIYAIKEKMNTPTIVIELSNSAIKILVGDVLNNKPIVLYATSRSTAGLIKNGIIVDLKAFVELIREISHIEDAQSRVRFDITRVTLVMPAIGFEIYEDKKSVNVVSAVGKIEKIDIANLISMIRKSRIRADCSFVDIIPTLFYVDTGQTTEIPYGVTSATLGMKAIIYTLPTQIVNSYRGSLENANIRIRRTIVAPHAIACLMAREKDFPETYIYVDVGADVTNISLIKKTHVYNSSYFLIGSNNLTNDIANAFNIDFKEAEKLKRQYGYDTRTLSFAPTIVSAVGTDGNEHLYNVNDLNKVIKNYLDNYIYSFDTCLNNLLSIYGEKQRDFPIVFGGGGSRLAGFLNYFKEKYVDRDVRVVPLNIVGARNQRYLNCVGALLAPANYVGTLEDAHFSLTSVARTSAQPRKSKSIVVDDDVL